MTGLVLLLLASSAIEQYNRANALFQQRKFAEAGESIDRALEADPRFVPALTLRGKLAMALGRKTVARESFEKAAALAPDAAYAQFMLGFFYYVENDFRKSAPALERASRLDPADPRAVLYLALSQEGLAQPELAISLYRKAIELEARADKPDPETYTAYGRLLFTLGRFEESARQVERVLELDPQSRDGHYERARLMLETGKFAKAAEEGEKALRSPEPGATERQIHFVLARAYAQLGRQDLYELHRRKLEESPASLRR
jgi:tetratricopeptide (TPR) repeat protein